MVARPRFRILAGGRLSSLGVPARLVLLGMILATPQISDAFAGPPQEPPKGSCCHVFIDYQFIWTLEMVPDSTGHPTPVLNIITLLDGEWDFRPRDIHISNSAGREARVERFAVDTGVPGEPFLTPYLKVHGDSFIGLDLVGDFSDFAEPASVVIDLDRFRFRLQPVDRLEFENIVQRVSQINLESPDIRDDYRILNIDLRGRREVRRRYY
ncbi:MAG: hypothetical protein Kow00109_19370 [Acidobacteriota bacterium]